MNVYEDKFTELTTYQLAVNLAAGFYSNEKDKFIALGVIQERDIRGNHSVVKTQTDNKRQNKPPLKGSKTEKIYFLAKEDKNPKEIQDVLKKKNISVYAPEIYRVIRNYFPERINSYKK